MAKKITVTLDDWEFAWLTTAVNTIYEQKKQCTPWQRIQREFLKCAIRAVSREYVLSGKELMRYGYTFAVDLREETEAEIDLRAKKVLPDYEVAEFPRSVPWLELKVESRGEQLFLQIKTKEAPEENLDNEQKAGIDEFKCLGAADQQRSIVKMAHELASKIRCRSR